jgi:hypothetical protein
MQQLMLLELPENGHSAVKSKMDKPFQRTYGVWLKLQSGQENVIRWGPFLNSPKIGRRIRRQNGHEHRCSVVFLAIRWLIAIRPYVTLDELLVTWCFENHDVPEGISGIDTPAPLKTDSDDLKEYLIFQELCRPLGKSEWLELERSFLLQFAIENPSCFPAHARKVMDALAKEKRNEALFFDGVQRFDYLHYALECLVERNVPDVLATISPRQCEKLDSIAKELPGFSEVIWIPRRAKFFRKLIGEFGKGIEGEK